MGRRAHLEVTVHDAVAVAPLDGRHSLVHGVASFHLGVGIPRGQLREELPSPHKLDGQVEGVRLVEECKELNNVGVALGLRGASAKGTGERATEV